MVIITVFSTEKSSLWNVLLKNVEFSLTMKYRYFSEGLSKNGNLCVNWHVLQYFLSEFSISLLYLYDGRDSKLLWSSDLICVGNLFEFGLNGFIICEEICVSEIAFAYFLDSDDPAWRLTESPAVDDWILLRTFSVEVRCPCYILV